MEKNRKKNRFSWSDSGKKKKDLAGLIAQVDKLYTD